MKVCIVGLGAIGGLFAAWMGQRLAPGRVQLSALARGATLAAVRAQGGLQLHGPQGSVTVALQAEDQPAALGVQDLLIVAVKGPALAGVGPLIAALSGPRTTVLVAMNGVPWWFFDGLGGPCEGLRLHSVDPGNRMRQWLPTAQVVGGVVHASSLVPAPGSVRPVKGQGLIIGRPAGGSDPALQALGRVLGDAGFELSVSPRIQRDIWFKLWGNMTMNPISALTGASSDRILDDPLVRAFNSAVMREAQAIGAAIGIPIEQDPEDRHAVTRKLGSFKTSMLQDLEAGRPLELDALIGAVREIGAHLRVATPHTDALFGLSRLLARERGLYPLEPVDVRDAAQQTSSIED
jgi:2-dehydropantoate 2-reductase